MIERLRLIWAVASPVEKFIFTIVPFTTIWDIYRGNWLDFIVGAVVVSWIAYDIENGNRD